jgi:hypothetical protein
VMNRSKFRNSNLHIHCQIWHVKEKYENITFADKEHLYILCARLLI